MNHHNNNLIALLQAGKAMKDVGYLMVKVFKADGLASADIGGKSDPFAVTFKTFDMKKFKSLAFIYICTQLQKAHEQTAFIATVLLCNPI